jgi:PilZ domain
MTKRKGWLESFLEPESERAQRRTVEQFAAYRWNGTGLVQEAVRDVSPTGVYILTKDRWEPGTLVTLTLQREGPLEPNSERRIDVRAKVARCGNDGVGLAFVIPKDDPNSCQWESLRTSLIEDAKPEDLQTLVRMSEAISMLSEICPGGAEEIGQLLRGRLSNHKLANAIEIALKAQSLLAEGSVTEELRADASLVIRVLENGSCTEEGWLKHFWGGLLATSCTTDGIGELSSILVELFSQLTTYPVRILVVVCTRATKILAESGLIFAKPLACKTEELMQTTGSRGPQIERDLRRLSELGLIEKADDNSHSLLRSDKVFITPTCLGLQLFAHCNGQKGSLREFYGLDMDGSPSGANQQRLSGSKGPIPINR